MGSDLLLNVGLFAVAALAVAVAGVRMVAVADRLADRTGMGEAVAGGVLLGLSTSLSGVVTSVTAAFDGNASLAFSNAVGGIAAQTAFLVAADLAYRRVNLEHAAADANNLLQAATLVVLLALPLAAYAAPEFTIWAVHPVSIVLFALYVFATRAAFTLKEVPMWVPRETAETRVDEPEEPAGGNSMIRLLLQFAGLAAVLGVTGYLIAVTGAAISAKLGVSQTVVGAGLTAVATSLPELVTTVVAVRRGALQLAVGGIVGGNTFDVLFLSLADAAYRNGSLYHAVGERDVLLLASAIVMTGILLMGLIMREKRGIGFEGLAIVVVYASLLALQVVLG